MVKQNKQQASGKGFGKHELRQDLDRVDRDLKDPNFCEIYNLVYELRILHDTDHSMIQSSLKKGFHPGYIRSEISIVSHKVAKKLRRMAIEDGKSHQETLKYIRSIWL